jgi:phosphoenolpyruvate carboxylase
MPFSDDILSLNPQTVDEEIVNFFRDAVGAAGSANPAAEALMHRIGNYVYIANRNKHKKREGSDRLAQVITEVSAQEKDNIAKAQDLAARLQEHVFTPAYTAHPTNPKSVETDDRLVDIYNLIMLMRNEKAAGVREPAKDEEKTATIRGKLIALVEASQKFLANADTAQLLEFAEEQLKEQMRKFAQMKLQPDVKMTVPQEVDRNLKIFGTAFREFNKEKRRVIARFCEENGIVDEVGKAKIATILTPAIARQFQEIHFWSASDADGNKEVTAQTMSDAVLSHQKYLDNLYKDEIAKLQIMFADNPFVLERLDAILGIVRAEDQAEAAGDIMTARSSAAVVKTIDGIIKAMEEKSASSVRRGSLAPDQKEALQNLRDNFECFGFVGPKMDVRQSSVRNETSMQQMLEFLRKERAAKNDRAAGIEHFEGNYKDEGFNRKAFGNYLRDPRVMDLLLEKLETLGDVATAEIKRMIVAKQHPEIFHRYIISDNKGIGSWDEVRTLELIANRQVNPKARPDFDPNPLTVYPLCETSQDIVALPEMIRKILSDEESVKTLNGKLHLFLGYSDAEKRGGIAALMLMQLKAKEALEIINAYNAAHPGATLEVAVFQAEGNDLIRGGPKPAKYTTEQGQGATDHLFKQYFKARERDAAGSPDDFEMQIEQLKKMEREQPALYALLGVITTQSVAQFEAFVTHGKDGEEKQHGDKLAAFLTSISMGDALAETNKSSRMKAKAPKGVVAVAALDLDAERAIGLATRFSGCGMQANVWQGMAGKFPQDDLLPELFERATVVQDMVYKSLYAVALCDPKRALKIAAINGAEIDRQMMRELNNSAFDALENIVNYLPMVDERQKAEILAFISDTRDDKSMPVSAVAKMVMAQVSNEFPVVQELLDNVRDHEEHCKKPIHGILDEYKGADAARRKDLDSTLAVFFREEMRVPEVICNLTTRTPVKRMEAVSVAAASSVAQPLMVPGVETMVSLV